MDGGSFFLKFQVHHRLRDDYWEEVSVGDVFAHREPAKTSRQEPSTSGVISSWMRFDFMAN